MHGVGARVRPGALANGVLSHNSGDNVAINRNSEVVVEIGAMDEALAFVDNVIATLGGVNVTFVSGRVVAGSSVDLDIEGSDRGTTSRNSAPGNFNTAFVFLDLSVNGGSAWLLRSLVNGLVGDFRPFSGTASIDGANLEQIASAGNERATVVSEGKSVRLGERSVLSVATFTDSVVPDEFVLKSVLVVGSIPRNINGAVGNDLHSLNIFNLTGLAAEVGNIITVGVSLIGDLPGVVLHSDLGNNLISSGEEVRRSSKDIRRNSALSGVRLVRAVLRNAARREFSVALRNPDLEVHGAASLRWGAIPLNDNTALGLRSESSHHGSVGRRVAGLIRVGNIGPRRDRAAFGFGSHSEVAAIGVHASSNEVGSGAILAHSSPVSVSALRHLDFVRHILESVESP